MRQHIFNLLTSSTWGMLEDSLRAMQDIVLDSSISVNRDLFHASLDMQAVIGTIGSRYNDSKFTTIKDSVGIIHIDGPILPRSIQTPSSGMTASLQAFSKDLQDLESDSRIKNIILSFDSPGGSITGVSEFSQMLANSSVPITSFVYGSAASAAYWMASQAKEIVIADTGMVGSIGVIGSFVDTSVKDEKNGIRRFDILSRYSKNKRIDPESEEGRKYILDTLDNMYVIFAEAVASGRNTTIENVNQTYGQGKMFIAKEAIELGMADRIGTLKDLVDELNGSYTQSSQKSTNMRTTMDLSEAKKEDVKNEAKGVYDEIVAESAMQGAISAVENLKSIESLADKNPSIKSFVDMHKYEAGMTKEKMALLVLEDSVSTLESKKTSLNQIGASLSDKIDSIESNTDTRKDNKDEFKLDAAAVQAGAKSSKTR